MLVKIPVLPAGCIPEAAEKNRTVLAHGEVTGHAHAVYHDINLDDVKKALTKIWRAPDGSRILEVQAPSHLQHEEHSTHLLTPGFYQLPAQMQYTPTELKKVTD